MTEITSKFNSRFTRSLVSTPLSATNHNGRYNLETENDNDITTMRDHIINHQQINILPLASNVPNENSIDVQMPLQEPDSNQNQSNIRAPCSIMQCVNDNFDTYAAYDGLKDFPVIEKYYDAILDRNSDYPPIKLNQTTFIFPHFLVKNNQLTLNWGETYVCCQTTNTNILNTDANGQFADKYICNFRCSCSRLVNFCALRTLNLSQRNSLNSNKFSGRCIHSLFSTIFNNEETFRVPTRWIAAPENRFYDNDKEVFYVKKNPDKRKEYMFCVKEDDFKYKI